MEQNYEIGWKIYSFFFLNHLRMGGGVGGGDNIKQDV